MSVEGLGSMNEERFEAYLGLIQKLLNCRKGQELALLQQHQALIDQEFVQVMQHVAAQMVAEGKRDTAEFLQTWAEELRNALTEPIADRPTPEPVDRDDAYMTLIKELLSCRKGSEATILKANEHLVDRGLAQQMQRVAAMLAEKGDQSDANFLLGLAQQLNQALSFVPDVPDTQLLFLHKVLQMIQEHGGQPERVLPLLQEHASQLDVTFLQALQTWADQAFATVDPKQALKLAADLVIFADLIQLLPQDESAMYEEIALASYHLALPHFPLKTFPNQWAIIHRRMGETHQQYRAGNRAAHVETAIQCFHDALKVYTQSDFPQEWALVQKDLGEAYRDRVEGDRTENLEQAVNAYANALKVYTD